MPPLELIATCAFGLEAVVVRELAALGYTGKPLQTGRVLFVGDESAIVRANLWLRAADRVFIRLGTFAALDFGVLFDDTFALPWERWLPADAEFPVSGRSLKSQLSSVPACQKIIKKAIVEKLRAAHRVAELPESGPKCAVEIALHADEATLLLDTTGPSLHKRGYRTLTGEAQLKETMAAALVLLSYWKPERPLVDPFCGTGTIPIEAAMIGRNLAPGLNRQFAAEAWPAIDARLWREARAEAQSAALPDLPLRIIGSDIDPAALSLARHHAENAGVAEQIHFAPKPFAELTSRRKYGCIITNPPYGERIGNDRELTALYRSMPEVFRRLDTWSFYVLTAYPDFEGLVGQPADRRRKLYNARIECAYYQFFGPKPPRARVEGAVEEQPADEHASAVQEPGDSRSVDRVQASLETDKLTLDPAHASPSDDTDEPLEPNRPAAAPAPKPERRPAFGGLTAKAREQAELFRSRLLKRARHLRRWPARGITCYRLYERDIPEVPLIVDRYENYLHLAEYERPHDRTTAEHADWLDLMVRTAGETLEVPRGDIYLKRRERQRGTAQYERYSEEGRVVEVQEAGLKFLVNLSDYLDTGLFLDHRVTRGMVREAAAGKRMLNLFAYTGSFSVYAAAGGAASTTTVDLSPTYLEWAQRNMRLNGFAGPEHRFVRSDALTFLADHAPGEHYDLAVVDPPTFSKSKRTEEIWDVLRDHAELLRRVIDLLTPGGVIYFSTNFRRFKLAEDQLEGVKIRDISRQTIPEDFRNERIHRAWRMAKE